MNPNPLSMICFGVQWVISCPLSRTLPDSTVRKPLIASANSFCPLPDTPAMPRISPGLTPRDIPRSAGVPMLLFTQRSSTHNTQSPSNCLASRLNGRASRPTIIRASSSGSVSTVATSPAFLPSRSTTTRSLTAITSCSLWLMMMTERPCATIVRSRTIRSCASCGVKTAVGSSMTNRSAPRYSALMISTRCCSPTLSCQT